MAGEDDGGTGRRVPFEHAADGLGGDRVDALERLVEEEHVRVVQQGGGEADLLAHAGGVVGDQLVGVVGEVEDGEQFLGPAVDLGARQSAQPAVVLEQLAAAEPLEHAQALGQDADPGLGGDRVGPDVGAVDEHGPLVGPEQAGDHRQRGGLSGAVRADQSDERPGRQLQAEPGDGGLAPEVLPQALDGHGRGNGRGHGGGRVGGRRRRRCLHGGSLWWWSDRSGPIVVP